MVVRRLQALHFRGTALSLESGMTWARAATAAAVAGLVAVASAVAAWAPTPGPSGAGRVAVGYASGQTGSSLEWQFAATAADRVPESVQHAASSVRIAVIDTGADLSAPGLAAKHVVTYNVASRKTDVEDTQGHGTVVASLAGLFGGDAQLMVVKAARNGSFTALDEAAAIRYAVDHGARIINLSLSGSTTSPLERSAVRYAVRRGALLVAAVGNDFGTGNPVEYPAALLQPVGSNGRGGVGLAVAASTASGARAAFSNTGSWVSLAAPGENVFAAISSLSPAAQYPRASLTGYGYASGTSYAAPQVAGAAALVWAANPALTAVQVADILKQTASGHGVWTPELGFGVIDVAAAVARAAATG